MPDYTVIDVTLGCVVANIIPGEATNLYLVGPSGSGKTEVLRALDGYHKIQAVSRVTANTFLSGYGKKKDVSLVVKLKKRGKLVVVMKDFTTVLSLRHEVRNDIFGQIREIADGKFDGFYGNDEEVNWEAKLAFIAGVTNVIDEHLRDIAALGERFLYYRMSGYDPLEVAKFSQENAGLEDKMRRELASGVRDFMETLKLHPVEQSPEIQTRLISLACIVAMARTSAPRDNFTGVQVYEPQAEGPSRLVKQLSQLGAGIANVLGKDEIDEDIYNILKKVSFDTMPGMKKKLIEWMAGQGLTNGTMASTSQIGTGTRMTINTARHFLEDFEALDIVKKRPEGTSYNWGLSPLFVKYLRHARILQ